MEKYQGLMKSGAVAVLCTLSGMFAYDLGWQQGGQRAAQIRELASPSPAARWSEGRDGGQRYGGSRYTTSQHQVGDDAEDEGGTPDTPRSSATPASRGLPTRR